MSERTTKVPMPRLLPSLAIMTALLLVPESSRAGSDFWPAGTPRKVRIHGNRLAATVLDRINATEAQRGALREISKRAAVRLKGKQVVVRAFLSRAVTLFSAEEIDRTEVDRLRRQLVTGTDRASRGVVDFAIEAAEVLTPQQRKQLLRAGRELLL